MTRVFLSGFLLKTAWRGVLDRLTSRFERLDEDTIVLHLHGLDTGR